MDILNRVLIKQEAKNFISQDRKWLTMALACLPLVLINGAISGGFNLILNFGEDGDVSSSSYSSGSSFVAWLLVPFMIGAAGYFLNHLRGMNPDWKSLYREGLDNYGTYFKVGVVTEIFIALWTFVFIIPGIIKTYDWYFVHQIIHDNPNLDGKQARDLSKKMTDGFKLEIFVMNLSFFFWLILSALTLGIAYLYVGPYMACTSAMYYENLKHHAITTGIAAPEEFGILPVEEVVVEENGYEIPVVPSYIEEAVAEITNEEIEEIGSAVEEAVEEVVEVETPAIEEIVEEDETNTEE